MEETKEQKHTRHNKVKTLIDLARHGEFEVLKMRLNSLYKTIRKLQLSNDKRKKQNKLDHEKIETLKC